MFRSKILGQEQFNQAGITPSGSINSDVGHFSIGPNELIVTTFEDVPIPPKHLWIRAQVRFVLCPETSVLNDAYDFIWPGNDRCSDVTISAFQILYAQKDYEVEKCWTIAKEQETYQHTFAVAPVMQFQEHSIHLWPCGGRIGNISQVEQLFAQVASDEKQVFVNSFNTWKKHLEGSDEVVFEPPPACNFSLNSALSCGKFSALIEQQGVQYKFSSCRTESTGNLEFIDILCERKDL